VAQHTYYGFKLQDGIKGLTRALSDASIDMKLTIINVNEVIFEIEINGRKGNISLTYTTTTNHPLARLGPISVLDMTVSDNLPDIKHIFTLAFLRGGG
jgi:hypothetical protein